MQKFCVKGNVTQCCPLQTNNRLYGIMGLMTWLQTGFFSFALMIQCIFAYVFLSSTLGYNFTSEKVQKYHLSFVFVKGSITNLFIAFSLILVGGGWGCNSTELNHTIIKSQNSYLFIEIKCWSLQLVRLKGFSSKSPIEIYSINWLAWIACSNKYFSNENIYCEVHGFLHGFLRFFKSPAVNLGALIFKPKSLILMKSFDMYSLLSYDICLERTVEYHNRNSYQTNIHPEFLRFRKFLSHLLSAQLHNSEKTHQERFLVSIWDILWSVCR